MRKTLIHRCLRLFSTKHPVTSRADDSQNCAISSIETGNEESPGSRSSRRDTRVVGARCFCRFPGRLSGFGGLLRAAAGQAVGPKPNFGAPLAPESRACNLAAASRPRCSAPGLLARAGLRPARRPPGRTNRSASGGVIQLMLAVSRERRTAERKALGTTGHGISRPDAIKRRPDDELSGNGANFYSVCRLFWVISRSRGRRAARSADWFPRDRRPS